MPISTRICSHCALLGAVLLLVPARSAYAQPNTFWLTAGLGVGTEEAGVNAGVNYQFNSSLLSLRATTSFALFGDDMWDIGLLYGLATRPAVFHASAGLGIAVVGGSRCEDCGLFGSGETRETLEPTIGLPLQVQLSFRPLRFVGLVLYGFGNLNKEESFGGVTAGVQLGRLR